MSNYKIESPNNSSVTTVTPVLENISDDLEVENIESKNKLVEELVDINKSSDNNRVSSPADLDFIEKALLDDLELQILKELGVEN